MTQRNPPDSDDLVELSGDGVADHQRVQKWLEHQQIRVGNVTTTGLSLRVRGKDGKIRRLQVLVDGDKGSHPGQFRALVHNEGSHVARPEGIYIKHFSSTHFSSAPLAVTTHAVPKWGEILLYFVLPKKSRDALPGCLVEEFNAVIVPKMGLRFARLWYWRQVLRAVPWVWLVAIYEFLKWKIGH